ncbi:unnamed protein product [Schistosoma margrebowiei]|uniref:Uncharacterized protein n=1 Tax=Schistosoma margrebowiei TaxID=48269 RepID=A0A183MZ23_9TREM|nr:unnamed protein product [Schistosoma margrebowiei]
MESSRPKEKRKTKEHITPINGDRHEKNEQELDGTRKEDPGQSGLENADRRPMHHYDAVESHTSSELNETQNHCEKKVFNQPTSYQNSHGIVPDMVCPDDSYISDEISYNFEENVSEE